MTGGMRCAAIVPAYNEADRIADTVRAIQNIAAVAGVVVVDDGSRDDSARIAMRNGALVCANPENRGKGAALELGCNFLEQMRPFGQLDAVLLLDGDLGASAGAAGSLLTPLVTDRADLSIAILPAPAGPAGFGLVQRLAAEGIASFGDGFKAQAPLSGQRALNWDCLKLVRPFAPGFAVEVAMTLQALRHKQRLIELPVALSHRAYGRNLRGFWHRGRQFLDVWRLLREMSSKC